MKYIFQIHLEKLKESPFVKHLTLTSSVYKMKTYNCAVNFHGFEHEDSNEK